MIIRNARVITFDRSNRVFDNAAVELRDDGSIGSIGAEQEVPERRPGHEIIDAHGRLLMPALINSHTHLYSTLARGIKLRGGAPRNFAEILKKLWWRLDSALDEDDVYFSALVGLIDSAKAGVATLIDHHSSPSACPGSLDVLECAFREVGLRGALCYETTDRNGSAATTEAIAENVRFIDRVRRDQGDDLIRASFGLHASFTLGDSSLRRCLEANCTPGIGFHIHVAEDQYDVSHSRQRFRKSPVKRLADLGVLSDRTIAAHCVRVSPSDVAWLARSGVNVVHNPQSNCNNGVGTANLTELLRHSVTVGLGSDGYSPRIWEEFLAAFHLQKVRTGDPRFGYSEALSALLGNRDIARRVFDWNIGAIEQGARADLMLVDYYPPTPLTSENLLGHMLFGIAHAPIHSLWVNGNFVVREGRCIAVDERAISEKAMTRARNLWARL